jgi:hypothetical protein
VLDLGSYPGSMRRSKRKIESSRANGAKSKGPKTPEGKRRSSYNAVRHGLLADCVVLASEDHANFEALVQQFVARFEPLDDVEFGMVEEMASTTWRMRRGWAAETELMDQAILRHTGPRPLAAAFTELAAAPALALLHRYETRLSRMYHRALHNLLTLREKKAQLQQLKTDPPAESEEFQTNPIPIRNGPNTGPAMAEIQPSTAIPDRQDPENVPRRPPGCVAA